MIIEKLRENIDRIDNKILDLLSDRAKIVKRIGTLKKKFGEETYVPHREKKIISTLLKRNKGPLSSQAIESIFREILHACRALESNLKVAYLGPEATFTHQAALKNFGVGVDYIPVQSIADVFVEVEKGRANYGVVPVENSTEGIINHTLDMFIESDLVICAEISLNIEHCLLSKLEDKKDIKRIYSHSQALAQCRGYLERNFLGVEICETSSTSEAAKKAKMDDYSAAIASRAAAILYGLNVIASNIQDAKGNYTRFLVIGTKMAERSGQDKTSIMFSIKDRVGALHDMLMSFKKENINLTKIESRPTKKKAWEYIFFVDFIGHISEKRVQNAIRELEKNCVFLKVLGSYPRAE